MSDRVPKNESLNQPGRGGTLGAACKTGAVRKAAGFRPAAVAAALGVALFLLLAPLRSFAQVVVVFTDQRSLVVSSHREEGGWVFLRLDSGEVAVPKALIAEIRNEGTQARESAKAAAQLVGPAHSSEEETGTIPQSVEQAQVEKIPQGEKSKGPWQPPVAGATASRLASAGPRTNGAPAALAAVPDLQGVKKR